ncbi:MAG: hypothetical protein E8D45_10235 [Nitrospira sp.]|nr:MAG: hypothetical protein E8D45_10235 [Nitrospira sp.]
MLNAECQSGTGRGGAKRISFSPCPLRLISYAVFAVLFLSACTTTPPVPDSAYQVASVERLAQLLKDREAALQSMKGFFRFSVKGPGIPFAPPMEGAVTYQRPGALRLRGFSPFGGELFDFMLAQERFRLKDKPNNKQYAGRLADLEHRPGIGGHIWLSVWAINSAIGNNALASDSRTELAEDGERYRLDVTTAAQPAVSTAAAVPNRRRLWFDRRTLQVVQEDRLDDNGAVTATMTFEDFRPVSGDSANGGAALVRPFKVTMKGEPGTLVLKFSEIVSNPTLKPEDLGHPGV